MEAIEKLVEDVKESFEDIGLYMVHYGVATSDEDLVSPDGEPGEPTGDFREKLISGEAVMVLTAQFSIGDVAWSDRVLYPESFETETVLQEQIPTEIEVYRRMIAEAGGDPFKLAELMEGEDHEDGSDG